VAYRTEETPIDLEGSGRSLVIKSDQKMTVPVLISARTRGDARAIESALWDFLGEYGYSKSDASSELEFEGSAFKRFNIRLKWKDFEIEFGFEKSSGSPSEGAEPEKPRAREVLEKRLAAVGGLLILGTALLATVAYAKEFAKQYHETFPPKAATQVEMSQDERRIIEVRLPTAFFSAIESADKDVENFKLLTGFIVVDQLLLQSETLKPPENAD